MSEHYILKCKVCKDIIASCRCPHPNKTIKYDICTMCKSTPRSEGLMNSPLDKTIIERLNK